MALLALLAGVALVGGIALPGVSAIGMGGTIQNVPPEIDGVYLHGADPSVGSEAACSASGLVAGFDADSGGVGTVWVCAEVSDLNGYYDVCAAGSFRAFSVSPAAGLAGSDAPVPTATGVFTCQAGTGIGAAIVGSFRFHGGSAAWGQGPYEVTVTVTDLAGGNASWNGTVAPVAPSALGLESGLGPRDQAAFGFLQPGGAEPAAPQGLAAQEGDGVFTARAESDGSHGLLTVGALAFLLGVAGASRVWRAAVRL